MRIIPNLPIINDIWLFSGESGLVIELKTTEGKRGRLTFLNAYRYGRAVAHIST
jgi:hypothetical protein